MRIVMKANNVYDFVEAFKSMQLILAGEYDGEAWIYKTDKGTYTFFNSTIGDGFVQFEGKRRSFGASPYFKVRRVKKLFGKDKLKMAVGSKEFNMKVTYFDTSAPKKPFWANCSKQDYRALQKLLAQ